MSKRANQGLNADRKTSTNYPLMARAEISLLSGNPAAADSLVAVILADDPNHVGALELLAKAQWQLNRSQPLLETLSKLIRINPYEPGYQALRGAALKNLGRYGEAIRAFLRAGDTPGSGEMISEIEGIQSELVLQLLKENRVFKAKFAQNPDRACTEWGFEFGSERKIRHHALLNEFSRSRLLVRPS